MAPFPRHPVIAVRPRLISYDHTFKLFLYVRDYTKYFICINSFNGTSFIPTTHKKMYCIQLLPNVLGDYFMKYQTGVRLPVFKLCSNFTSTITI